MVLAQLWQEFRPRAFFCRADLKISSLCTRDTSAVTNSPAVARPLARMNLSVDLVRRIVKSGGEEVKLSPKEYELLRLLI